MMHRFNVVLHKPSFVLIVGVLFGGTLGLCGNLPGQKSLAAEPTVYKVEEDWELVVNQPDASSNSPQITFFTSPSHLLEDSYFQLQMNYHAADDYSSGGFHVASVSDDQTVDDARSMTRKNLATNDDLIRWTSVMAVIDNRALFAVRDGYGREWGSFGGPDYLVRMVPSPVPDLSNYRYQESMKSVDIGFGRNRVSRITLKAVRLFYTNGHVAVVSENQNL
ncbi:hypothetical protein N9B39_01255 [bacterium]|nr:hypothetical protein [Rubripirellula sp.]MDA7865043.1 hypothetical protein [bacterium]MDA7878154.1 hypothetical protein [bacterium]MDA8968389.1 hypothetical protein [bacterium]